MNTLTTIILCMCLVAALVGAATAAWSLFDTRRQLQKNDE